MTRNDVLIVEHYDLLRPAERIEYREAGDWEDTVDDQEAVAAEFDRIDGGRKALCLS
jgi:hypothetical protein